MEGRKERKERKERETCRGHAGSVASCAHPSQGPGKISLQFLSIQEVCHALLPIFRGEHEAAQEGLAPVPAGPGTLPGLTLTNAQCWLHASGGPAVSEVFGFFRVLGCP